MKAKEISPRFKIGSKVIWNPPDTSREPAKTNAGKRGIVHKIYSTESGYSYFVKFGKGIWDEACVPEEELELKKGRNELI